MKKKEIRRAVRSAFIQGFAEGRPPNFTEGKVADWINAVDEMILGGELELAEYAVRAIHEMRPNLAWGNNLAELFAQIPQHDPDAPKFVDNSPKALQVVPRAGADTVVLVFCGAENRVGMPLPMLHRWLSRIGVSLIYLRDRSERAYLGGVADAGPDLAATLTGLKALIQDLAVRRVVCYGNSIGGYGALRYGVELGADAVLSMAGIVNLRTRFNAGLHYEDSARKMEATFPGQQLDNREVYLSAGARPSTLMVYGEHNWDDRIHAEHMAGIEGVTLMQIDGSKNHNVAAELIRSGRFDDLLRQAAAVSAGAMA